MSGEIQAGPKRLQTRCCIAGGGPAGMMLGFLLARSGVDVVVLEKHADFLRDFRGDTIHPSTLELMHELGILDEFLARPHQEARELTGVVGDVTVPVADFTHLPTRCRFIAFMPQWDFLDFLAEHARRFPAFHLHMQGDVTGLIEEEGRVVGVRATTPSGPLEVRAQLTVGADGRHSTVRQQAGLAVETLGAPIDVLWMRLSRRPEDPDQPLGRFDRGRVFVMLFRGEYWQCGFLIPKGGYDVIKERGLESFREEIVAIAPLMKDRVAELSDWNQIRLLTVAVDRLRRWYRPGLLCIGDAAHAMSPIGGVGINLAIQDAVAAANILADRLRDGSLTTRGPAEGGAEADAAHAPHPAVADPDPEPRARSSAGSHERLPVPWALRLLQRWPLLRRIPARLIGVGLRPEHVRTVDVHVGRHGD